MATDDRADRAMLVYAGDAEAGECAIAPFRALATPIADLVKPRHSSSRVMVNVAAFYEGQEDRPARLAWDPRLVSRANLGSARDVKAHYDPTNLFRLNQNVPPEVSA